jgi:CubicO group peptidase (beta-lactamase class C family)
MTKTFTGIALARAIEQGRVRLDQPIQELLPAGVSLPEPARGVTLRHLTTHTSGFPRLPGNQSPLGGVNMLLWGGDPCAGYAEADLLAAVPDVKLESKPGTESSYSNFGVGLLAWLLAARAGTNVEALLKQEICRPLGMDDTGVTLDAQQVKRYAQGYRAVWRLGPVVFALRSSPWLRQNCLGGAGALRSSANDLLRYLRANMRPEGQTIEHALRESHRELFRENDDMAFGMNWVRSRKRDFNQTVIWHNGGTGGFRSFLGFTEDGRTGVVILSNTTENVDPVALNLLRELAKPRAGTSNSAPPKN